jgi:hypothetical protein
MAGDIESFHEQIEGFKKKMRPVTFLDLMAEDVAKNPFGDSVWTNIQGLSLLR